mmetsp:Transcript_22000/g.43972  ORF Transcript_22000/g.43972 Transcript_22000/m.43972 type:complete len:216 (+) Transcript_22000:538-1185(+)
MVVTFFNSYAPGSSSNFSTERQCGPVYPLLHLHCFRSGEGTPKRPGVTTTHEPFDFRVGLDVTLVFSSLFSRGSDEIGGASNPAIALLSSASSSSEAPPSASFVSLSSFFICLILFVDDFVSSPSSKSIMSSLTSSSSSSTAGATSGCTHAVSTSSVSIPPPPQSSSTTQSPPPFFTSLKGCLSLYTNGGFLMYLYSYPLINSLVGNSTGSQPRV